MRTVSISQAKASLAKLLSEVEEVGEEIVITRSGRPKGVLLSFRQYDGLLEAAEILADQELSRAIREGVEEAARGDLLRDLDV